MKKASDLFYTCAIVLAYDKTGEDVSYKFIEEGKTLYIYFQGSKEKKDWLENFNFFPMVKNCFKWIFSRNKKAFSTCNIMYHRGFLKCYNQVKPIIREKVLEKDADGNYKFNQIVVVGYSHGAALAGICHEDISHLLFEETIGAESLIVTYCFEAPRWLYHSKQYLDRWNGCYVFRNHNDIVTHCPPRLFGFRDAGTVINIGRKKKTGPIKSHYPFEVYDSLVEWESID